MTPRIVDKKQKQRLIIEAAIHVFAQKGYVNTKMIDIAITASVGKGTIYEYFRSKEEIFAAAFNLVFNDIRDLIQQSLAGTDDPAEQLKLVLQRCILPFTESENDFAAIIMDFWAEGIREKDDSVLSMLNLKELYTYFRKTLTDLVQRGIDRGDFRAIDPHYTAALIIGTIDGIMLQWTIDRTQIDPRQAMDVLLDLIIKGIGNK